MLGDAQIWLGRVGYPPRASAVYADVNSPITLAGVRRYGRARWRGYAHPYAVRVLARPGE